MGGMTFFLSHFLVLSCYLLLSDKEMKILHHGLSLPWNLLKSRHRWIPEKGDNLSFDSGWKHQEHTREHNMPHRGML